MLEESKQQNDDIFSYENLENKNKSSLLLAESSVYRAVRDGQFYVFRYKQERDPPDRYNNRGWKFHVGVNDKDLSKAWNIVKEVLIENNIEEFKVANSACNFSTTFPLDRHGEPVNQQGKQITIYTNNDPRAGNSRFWEGVLQEIETRLRNANIEPEVYHKNKKTSEYSVPGSTYIRYRNDRGANYQENEWDYNDTDDPNISGEKNYYSSIKLNRTIFDRGCQGCWYGCADIWSYLTTSKAQSNSTLTHSLIQSSSSSSNDTPYAQISCSSLRNCFKTPAQVSTPEALTHSISSPVKAEKMHRDDNLLDTLSSEDEPKNII